MGSHECKRMKLILNNPEVLEEVRIRTVMIATFNIVKIYCWSGFQIQVVLLLVILKNK